MGRGGFGGWAGYLPLSLFLISLFLFPFSFLFSELFHRICKNASNQFKQVSKFFKYSKQCFKTVRCMFLETKQDF
jgi:hypothetical protein